MKSYERKDERFSVNSFSSETYYQTVKAVQKEVEKELEETRKMYCKDVKNEQH